MRKAKKKTSVKKSAALKSRKKPVAKKSAVKRKKKKVLAIPKGYNTITSYLIVGNAGKAIEFYKKAFGAKEMKRMEHPGSGKVAHAELKIGDSKLMLADECPEMKASGPKA